MRRLVLLLVVLAGCSRPNSRVVLYCAQDQEFADALIQEFSKDTQLNVAAKFDTEAAKSVGLVAELQMEIKRPRCDVHWNNETLGSVRLQRQGVYEEYRGKTWHPFAARARVLVVSDSVPEAERPGSLFDLTAPRWKGQVAMSKPQFGTNATQAACLWEVLGPDAAKRYYEAHKANDIQIVAGNKQAAEAVSKGTALIGLTDTDDAWGEVEAKRAVTIVVPDAAGHPDHPRMGTLLIPNTVALVKDAPNPVAARKFLDFLLSEEVERQLAEGPSRQMPLNPAVKADLPPMLQAARAAKAMRVDWEKAADRWDEAQAVMRDLFAR